MTTANLHHRRSAASLCGSAGLVRLALRSSWLQLLGVLLVSSGLVTAVASSIATLYPGVAAREQYAATLGESPATQAFNGRGYALDTVGGITAYEISFIGQLLFPLMALHIALRLTRREEEAGRIELLTAARVGRVAPLVSAALLLLVLCVLAGMLIWAGMTAAGLPATGAAWYGAGTASLMLFFGALGLFLGQLAQSTRTGYLTGLGVLTAMYLVRALVDGLDLDAVWVSPLGWQPELRAFGDPQLWPLSAFLVSAAVLGAAAIRVAASRDLGAGVFAPRKGPSHAGTGLSSSFGLAWRLNRPAILAWAALAVIWAGVFGLLTREMTDLVEANPVLLEALGVTSGSDVVVSLAVVVVILAATGAAVQCYGRLAGEESSGRLGVLLATGTHRGHVWLVWWVLAATAAVLILLLGCLALGITTWAVLDDSGAMGTVMEIAAGYAVPTVFVTSVAALLCGVGGAWYGLTWLLVGWIAVVGFLADTLQLAEWSRLLSPLHAVGQLPQDDPAFTVVVGLGAGAVLLLLGSLAVFGRRDLSTG